MFTSYMFESRLKVDLKRNFQYAKASSMFNPLIKYKEPSRRKLQLIPMDRNTLRTIAKFSQFNQTLLLNHYLIPIHKLIFFQTFLKHLLQNK